MENITISKNLDYASKEKMKLYSDIFGYEPRNEGFICWTCGMILPKDFYGKCNCGERDSFTPFYPYPELKKQFQTLSQKPWYCEWIATALNDESVWFILGRDTDMENLNNDKLWLTDEELLQLQQNIQSLSPNFTMDNFFYCADMGVKYQYRGQWIASLLYQERLKRLKNNGKQFLVVRTTKKSDKPYKWYLTLGFQEVFSYNDQQDRVILSLTL